MLDSSGATVFDDLPEFLVIDEILVRLPPKDVLRCRAVRKSWRRATSTGEFARAHHRRQPSRPLVTFLGSFDGTAASQHHRRHEIGSFDGTAPRQFVVRYSLIPRNFIHGAFVQHGALDGMVLASSRTFFLSDETFTVKTLYHIFNPSTRHCAPLEHLPNSSDTCVAGFYRHQPSKDYRVLYITSAENKDDDDKSFFCILTVGSDEQRRVEPPLLPPGSLGVLDFSWSAPVFYSGCLHWQLERYCPPGSSIMVFDTIAEKFRWMRHPAPQGPWAWLLDMDGVLAFCSTANGILIDVSVVQDYEARVWVPKCRINLSSVSAPLSADELDVFPMMAVLNKDKLLIMPPGHRLFYCDIAGKLLGATDARNNLELTSYVLQDSIILLPLSQLQDEDKEPPFTLGL